MMWDVKHTLHEQIWTVLSSRVTTYNEARDSVFYWRNEYRNVTAELLAHAFFFYEEELGIWFSLQKVHRALGAQ